MAPDCHVMLRTGAAAFSAAEVAQRTAAWERRQQGSQAAAMAQSRAALPIGAHRCGLAICHDMLFMEKRR